MAIPEDGVSQWRMFTGEQLRAARALLKWSRDQLADASGISAIAIKEFEGGASDPKRSTLIALRGALAKAGVVFLEETDMHGPGVAFSGSHKRKSK
ncbi:MAG: helix-turn-helix transcriptional regulator [Hyphomicrobium sp.]|uniref:helix-turn-helix domain-containing protein n=1 Tax=Hyphomicrobium sp. TaxID=82 RepID=UPI0039E305B6